jgi:hypothetical protein
MLVGGSAIVIAFLVGALTGRATGPERTTAFVVPAPLPTEAAPVALPVPTTEPAETVEPSNVRAGALRNGVLPPKAPPNEASAPAKQSLPAFNAKAAKSAIDGVSPRLKACKHAGDPVGPASVMVTFAPAGRVSNAAVTTTGYAGTRTGNCIVQRLRDLRIPEFTGAAVTVKRSVTVR